MVGTQTRYDYKQVIILNILDDRTMGMTSVCHELKVKKLKNKEYGSMID